MDSKGKSHEVEAIPTPAQIAPRKKDKKRKGNDLDVTTALNKKISQTPESGRKLQKNSDHTEKDTEEYVCLFESGLSDMKHSLTIFVKGFDCSIPMGDIKSTLRKHFSSCGEVSTVFIPYECKTGSPLGYGFINMAEYPEKALALDGSSLGGMTLEVTMARKRDEFSGYRNHKGCERCRNALMKRLLKKFHDSFRSRIPRDAVLVTEP